MEFNSTALILCLTLVSPLRNWLNSTKSSKRLKVFIFSIEYEMFCEPMQRKRFKNVSSMKWKRVCSLNRLFNLLSECLTLHFQISEAKNITCKYIKRSVTLSMQLLGHLTVT